MENLSPLTLVVAHRALLAVKVQPVPPVYSYNVVARDCAVAVVTLLKNALAWYCSIAKVVLFGDVLA